MKKSQLQTEIRAFEGERESQAEAGLSARAILFCVYCITRILAHGIGLLVIDGIRI